MEHRAALSLQRRDALGVARTDRRAGGFGLARFIPWFIAYIVMTVISGFFDYYLALVANQDIDENHRCLFALNFAAMSSIIIPGAHFVVRWQDQKSA